jgi:beta-galactosidase
MSTLIVADLACVRTASRTCLNGWWDFQSAAPTAEAPSSVPTTGWELGAILVPSFFTKPCDITRRKGERLFKSARSKNGASPQALPVDTEFLFDAYGYPLAWAESISGWYRRSLQIAAPSAGERLHLNLEGVQPVGVVFFNGQRLDSHPHPTLPHRVDITNLVRPGDNELAVFCADYPRGADGRPVVPTGNGWIVGHQGGIWQDTWLERRGTVHVAAVDIRTLGGRVNVAWELTNAGETDLDVTLKADIAPWRRGEEPLDASRDRMLPAQTVRVPAGQTVTTQVEVEDTGLARWSPHRPQLYWLRTSLSSNGRGLETQVERFGVRELRVAGKDYLLDGTPIHLFSDWGHKLTPYHHTEGWIRQWFAMIKAANQNHSRLHTHPHPRLVLDLADEEGIMITGETGIHGSGRGQGTADPRYWINAADHVQRFVARDRNHPCIVMWSVENEMRWNGAGKEETLKGLPELRRLFNRIDPTRAAYHEGDSTLWIERDQTFASRHYGKECAGEGWWDQQQPLHCGEMSLHHLMGPNNTQHLAGDAVYADYAVIDASAGEDTKRIVESGRSRGVIAWGPWNLSCLVNQRTSTEFIRLSYPDWSAPGIKPLQVPPRSSEFNFWQPETPGFGATPSFAKLRDAFRPVALVDRSYRAQYRHDQSVSRSFTLVNDSIRDLAGEVVVNLGGIEVAKVAVAATRGRTCEVTVTFTVPVALNPGRYDFAVTFTAATGEVDRWTRDWRIAAPFAAGRPLTGLKLVTVGAKAPVAELTELGAQVTASKSLADVPASVRLIVVGRSALVGDEAKVLADLTARGARVLLLEQSHTPFPGLTMRPSLVATAWKRAHHHPVLAGLDDADLAFWGETGYAAVEGDHLVAYNAYNKGDARYAQTLVDSGEGGFGSGDLDAQLLLEIVDGAGLILASQFRIDGRTTELPAAETLLVNAVRRLATWQPVAGALTMVAANADADEAVAAARAGATVLVDGLGQSHVAAWAAALSLPLEWIPAPEQHWQAVRVTDRRGASDPLLAGLSNEDFSGVERWTYRREHPPAQPVAAGALAPTAGLEALLTSPSGSCLYELFVQDGNVEPLRAHTASRFCYGDERAPACVLFARVRVGSGQVLLSLLDVPPTHVRLNRWRFRLAANLGVAPSGSIFTQKAAEFIPGAIPHWEGGNGTVSIIHRSKEALDDATWAKLTAGNTYYLGREWNQPYLRHVAWERLAVIQDGLVGVCANWQPGQSLLIATTITSKRPRKNLGSNLGVPNPEDQLFADIHGQGRVEGQLNLHPLGAVELVGGVGTFPDLEFEEGHNHLILRWWPKSAEDQIKIHIRDIMRRADFSLGFG